MNGRAVAGACLAAILGFSILAFAAGKPDAKASAAARPTDPAGAKPAGASAATAEDRHVIAYYFHGAVRCRTCRKIEATAEEVLRERFGDDLNAGRLEWRVVNYDEPANEHFIKDFKLVAPSLVLVGLHDGRQDRFKSLDKVWQYAHDEQLFKVYVRDEVRAFLRGANG